MGFEQLKEQHSAMWGSAPFERVSDSISSMHDHLVDRLAPSPGDRWLDLAPALIETARSRAAEEGLPVRFEVGDAERLPYGDGSFDVVSSAVGVMFAPDHGAVAAELARVCRPGARLGLACWRPEGHASDCSP
jgi:SAM-dependent methyltransferase